MTRTATASVVIVAYACAAWADEPWSSWPVPEVLSEERRAASVVVAIDADPVYFAPKRFHATPLTELVRKATEGWSGDRLGSTDVVFDCTDDYRARMPLARFLGAESFVAFRDAAAPAGGAWVEGPPGPKRAAMGDAYVVWPGVDPTDRRYAWPYAVTTIRLAPADSP